MLKLTKEVSILMANYICQINLIGFQLVFALVMYHRGKLKGGGIAFAPKWTRLSNLYCTDISDILYH